MRPDEPIGDATFDVDGTVERRKNSRYDSSISREPPIVGSCHLSVTSDRHLRRRVALRYERRYAIVRTVALDVDLAVTIGAPDADARGFEGRDRRRGGVSEKVLATDGDDRIVRRDRSHEFGRRAVRRAVMADFKNVGALDDYSKI